MPFAAHLSSGAMRTVMHVTCFGRLSPLVEALPRYSQEGFVASSCSGLESVGPFGVRSRGGLNKLGMGTLTFGGTNTYNDATTITAGTLSLVARPHSCCATYYE